MKKWYLFFYSSEATDKFHQLDGGLQHIDSKRIIKLHQVGVEIDSYFPQALGLVPWRHQVNIITQCKSVDEAVFNLKERILNGWTRQTSDNSLRTNLYKTHGNAIQT